MAVWNKRAAGQLMGLCMLMLPAMRVMSQRVDTGGKSDYTLQQLIDHANHHLPILLQKQALVKGAEAGIKDARHAYLPKVSVVEEVSIGSANDLTGAFLPMPGVLHAIAGGITAENSYRAGTSNIASLYGEYELVNFGLRNARITNARAYAGVQAADLVKETYVMKWQIAKLWLELRKAGLQLSVTSEDIRRNEAMYTITTALTSTGINAGVDSSLAKAGLSRARVNYNLLEGRLRAVVQQLNYYTGVKVAPDTVVLEEGIAVPLDTAVVNPLSELYVRQREQFRTESDLIRKTYLPKIMVGAGGWARGSSIQFSNDYKSLDQGLGFQRLNYMAGIGISYDLFNGVRKKDKLAVAQYQERAAGYALEQQELSLRNAAAQAEESMTTADRNLHELPVQLQAARDAYSQKVAQYKAGIINLIDLSNASFVLYQAQTDLVETRNSWYMAALDKAAATGQLDRFIQSLK